MNDSIEIPEVDMTSWMNRLSERQRQEVRFAREYAANFNHGTDGHHRLNLIAELADILDNFGAFMVGEKVGDS